MSENIRNALGIFFRVPDLDNIYCPDFPILETEEINDSIFFELEDKIIGPIDLRYGFSL